jgi:hypothetical protein
MIFKVRNTYIFINTYSTVIGPPPPRLGYVMQYNAEITWKTCELWILLSYETNFVFVFKRNGTNTVFKKTPFLIN